MKNIIILLTLILGIGLTGCKKEEVIKKCPHIVKVVEVRQYYEYRIELDNGVKKLINYEEAEKISKTQQTTYCD